MANGANFTVVVRRREGLKGAERGRGLGPCIEHESLREDDDGMRVGLEDGSLGISRYAEPDAEGTMPVCRTTSIVRI